MKTFGRIDRVGIERGNQLQEVKQHQLYSIRPTMLAAMCRGVSLKRRTLFGSAPFLKKRELVLWMWMRVEIHFHGVIQTNYGAIIAIPNLILWEDRKSPEEELNVFDCIDANCRLKL